MNYWVVRLGTGGEFAELAKQGNYIAIGWVEVNDLSSLKQKEGYEAKELLLKALAKAYGKGYTKTKRLNAAGQIIRFVREMNSGEFRGIPGTHYLIHK